MGVITARAPVCINNSNGYFERLTRTDPKHLHILWLHIFLKLPPHTNSYRLLGDIFMVEYLLFCL